MKKRIITLMMMLCMIFSLCACGNNSGDVEGNKSKESQTSQTEEGKDENSEGTEDTSEDTGKVEYKVILVDQDGNPVGGAMVQICKEACVPSKTGEDGVAVFSLEETDGYKASIMSLPKGYVYEGAKEIYFEGDVKEVTFTVTNTQ